MTCRLRFHVQAWEEWQGLDKPIREQFKKKLEERLEHPRVESARINGLADAYKIKLRSAGFRLVYHVQDRTVTVIVLSVGKRERHEAYKNAIKRV